ncbi:MAG: Rne/Rng family ribonuclease [Roseinatronobacter sp.]
MAQKMLIDATHAEETRIVVVDGNKVEEFDFETASRRQLAGNIYLAKVTRVEPSLQAAFVDYGGNRHGFLAFNEIHPDYYQIPAADRAALLAEERALAAEQDEEDDPGTPPRSDGGKKVQRTSSRRKSAAKPARASAPDQVESQDVAGMDIVEPSDSTEFLERPADAAPLAARLTAHDADAAQDSPDPEHGGDSARGTDAQVSDTDLQDARGTAQDEPYRAADHATEIDDRIEAVSDGAPNEEERPRRRPRMRRYKIQEVIKVRQIMLVQVVKEERGNKGAALTTYLSLAGRYCVLMPNTARGGGISRKITNAADRQKLKAIAAEIKVPEGAGLIIRTAGAQRTRAEVKRDYEYLLRLWEQIRDLTLKSIAPTPIYEEGDLIKRTIRDLYNKHIDEVLVEGEAGYRVAKDFMKMIMPSHAKNVKLYQDPMPLFARYQVESYLAGMFNPTVQLPSGGYIVIGITEALVAIDINSGRATREGSIEETALKTNLEAAAEIARQLRLRDLAGLIVIDFIDMEERKNNAAVEKMLKDKLKDDRARIQVGRISGFGLLEMSRQRMRPGMLEATTQPCPHCHGTGLIRSDDSMGLTVLRQIEEEGTRGKSREVLVRAPAAVVNFIINFKREHLAQIEARYSMAVRLEADPRLVSPDFEMEKFKTATRVPVTVSEAVSISPALMADLDDEVEIEEDEDEAVETVTRAPQAPAPEQESDGQPRKKRRRRRRRRGGAGSEGDGFEGEGTEASDTASEGEGQDEGLAEAEDVAAETGEGDALSDMARPATARPEETVSAAEVATTAPVITAEDAPVRPARKRATRSRRKVDPKPQPAEDEAVVQVDIEAGTSESGAVMPDTPPMQAPDDHADVPMVQGAADPVATMSESAAGAVAAAETAGVVEAPAPEIPAVVDTADTDSESAAVPVPADLARDAQSGSDQLVEQPDQTQQAAPEMVTQDTSTSAPAPEPSGPKRRGWWSGTRN